LRSAEFLTTKSTTTAKGQVTLKKDILDQLGVKPGDHLDVRQQADGSVLLMG
jgi:AbrB family looped-hinge helix DNA binding protein